MKTFALAALLLAALVSSPGSVADPAQLAEPVPSVDLAWLQAGSSCEGEAGGAEILVSCPGQTAAQCCRTARSTYTGFVGVCQGDAEIQCG